MAAETVSLGDRAEAKMRADWLNYIIEFLCSLEHELIPDGFIECVIHAFNYVDQKHMLGGTILGVEALANTEDDATFTFYDYHNVVQFIESGFTRIGDRVDDVDDFKVRFCEVALERLTAEERLQRAALPQLTEEDAYQVFLTYVQQWEDEAFELSGLPHSVLLGVPLTLLTAFLGDIGGFTAHLIEADPRAAEKPAYRFQASKGDVKLTLTFHYEVVQEQYLLFRNRLRVFLSQQHGAANDG